MTTSNKLCDQASMQDIVQSISAMDDAKAVELLDKAVAYWPEDPRLHFLRGSLQAQIRLYDRAAVDFGNAVKLDPEFHIARFQLGLLHLTSGRPEQALEVWAPLEQLADGDCLKPFKQGLTHLIYDRFDECVELLKAGIAANTQFPPLSGDMQMMIDRIQQRPPADTAVAPQAEPEQGADAEAKADSNEHILLAGYMQSTLKH